MRFVRKWWSRTFDFLFFSFVSLYRLCAWFFTLKTVFSTISFWRHFNRCHVEMCTSLHPPPFTYSYYMVKLLLCFIFPSAFVWLTFIFSIFSFCLFACLSVCSLYGNHDLIPLYAYFFSSETIFDLLIHVSLFFLQNTSSDVC